MALTPGTRLGLYEILAAIGSGGVGEVYRARDARLDRTVAIKILPAAVAADGDGLRRFEREARAASALNHPNIVTIYELGEDGSTHYIAMELIEGKTLREMLTAGSLPIRRTIEIAAQVAEGLAKAHEAGIAHRDLKPENLMVSHDGFVKILDFGLAKLASASGEVADATSALSSMQTRPGVILGTLGYMSPEQASGGPLDFRSDQFSFGTVLYEMVSGKRAFRRGTAPETLVAILKEQAEPIAVQNPDAPAPLCWAIERCLEKDPDKRYVSTRDLARELAAIRDRFSEKPAKQVETRPSNIPVQRTGFVGREKEIAAANELLLRQDVRLVTITGPGGIGKTRLAVEMASALVEHFPGGVHFVPLSPLRDPCFARFAHRSDLGDPRGRRPVTIRDTKTEFAGFAARADAAAARQFRALAAGHTDRSGTAGHRAESKNSGDQPRGAAPLRRARISGARAGRAGYAFQIVAGICVTVPGGCAFCAARARRQTGF